MSVERRRCDKCFGMVTTDLLQTHRTTCEGPKPKPKPEHRMDVCQCGRPKLRRVPCCWQCEVKNSEFDWARLDRAAKASL